MMNENNSIYTGYGVTLTTGELQQFATMGSSSADVGIAAPKLTILQNAHGFVTTGNTVVVSGQADPGATIKVYLDNNILIGSGTADKTGVWNLTTDAFQDGMNYKLYATATDAAGHTSPHSDLLTFNIDNTPPVMPTVSLNYTAGSNEAGFSGTGEAGTVIELMRASDLTDIARATVGADGKWSVNTSPLPNGTYDVIAVSSDEVNATTAGNQVNFAVSNPNNMLGTAGKDQFKPGAGNNAVDGAAGVDTAVYAGTRANYTVKQGTWGYDVTDNVGTNGHDALINVERIQFDDGYKALDVDGTAGQVFRLYQAAFDRPAEQAGMGYWLWSAETVGKSQATIAGEFMKQPEYIALYGANPSNAQFIDLLYANVMHRAPDQAGYQYWNDMMEVNHLSRVDVLLFFSESPENQAQVIGSIQNGIDFQPWKG
jgi:serralysin